MTNRLPLRSFAALLLAAPLSVLAALDPADWQQRQDFTVDAPGVVRVSLPPATFDVAQSDLRDLRLIDAAGREQPFHVAIARERPARTQHAARFTSQLRGDTSLLTLATGTSEPLAAVTFETPHPRFMKAVRVELSEDGENWTTLDQGLPLFRQWGAEQLRVPLHGRRAAHVRLQFDDSRAHALPITGAILEFASGEPASLRPISAEISRQEKFAGETVLTLTLAGKHVPLARLDFEATDPLFTRHVTIAVRQLREGEASERVVASGTIFRVQLAGAPVRENLSVPVVFSPAAREVLVHIHDGDSPALSVGALRVWQREAAVIFHAASAGDYALLSGNPQAIAPRYDLAQLGEDLLRADAAAVTLQPPRANPAYAPREVLADVALTGGPFAEHGWKHARAVRLAASGVQELELDVAALAAARGDFADLRLSRDAHQVPYLLERTQLARTLPLALNPAPDPKRPHVGRWTLTLPAEQVPLRALVLASSDALFQRTIHLSETVRTHRGDTYNRALAQATWTRTPAAEDSRTLTIPLELRPQSRTLTLEVDNGDNPPLTLATAEATYPVVRLVFKAAAEQSLALHYGKADAAAPRYDIALVARQLLVAARHPARLDDAAATANERKPLLASLRGGAVFWIGLGVVVLVLLAVVAKLLPKPAA